MQPLYIITLAIIPHNQELFIRVKIWGLVIFFSEAWSAESDEDWNGIWVCLFMSSVHLIPDNLVLTNLKMFRYFVSSFSLPFWYKYDLYIICHFNCSYGLRAFCVNSLYYNMLNFSKPCQWICFQDFSGLIKNIKRHFDWNTPPLEMICVSLNSRNYIIRSIMCVENTT